MTWQTEMVDGFALAAIAADDATGRAAEMLGAEPAARVRERLDLLAALDSSARRAAIREMAGVLAPPIDPERLPERARALLDPNATGPAVRRGFVASPALRAALRRAAAPTLDAAARAERELSELSGVPWPG